MNGKSVKLLHGGDRVLTLAYLYMTVSHSHVSSEVTLTEVSTGENPRGGIGEYN